MNLIDTHTHLYMPDSFPDGEGVAAVERAIAAGVNIMIFPGVNEHTIDPMEDLHKRFPHNTLLAAGVHPDDLREDWQEQLAYVRKRMKDGDYIAVGEVGIDLYRITEFRERQKSAFAEQIRWAIEDDIPVIIHCREGLDETLEVIESFDANQRPPFLFHSFTYTPKEVTRIREIVPEALFGINGVATFKNAPEVREAVKEIGLRHIVLETDAPYLSPVPFRGKRNESAMIPYIAHSIADTLGLPEEDVAKETSANAYRFFNINAESTNPALP